MASVNKAIVIGNLGRDPELRSFPDGGAVCNVSIATTRRWRDKQSGDTQEETEWHRVAFHGRLAEIAGEYLRKGSAVYVEGRLKTRKWTDKEGQDRYTTEIEATEMQMLGSRQGMGAPASSLDDNYGAPPANYQPSPPQNKPKPAFDDLGDDIPF